jgi:type I restriction enzyme S subunit
MIPTHWTTTALVNICIIKDGQRIPINRKERDARIAGKERPELYPYYGATGQVGWIDDFIFDGTHVLLGEDGAPFHDPTKTKAYIATGKYWVNNHAHILEACVNPRFLCHYLNQIQYHDHVTGTTRLKLNQKAMKAIPVRIAPFVEQRAIVEKIEALFSELDQGVAQLEAARAQLKRYRQAVLKAAFEGKLTADWREQQLKAGNLPTADDLLDRIKAERAARYEQQLADWKRAVEDWEAQAPGTGKASGQKKPRKPAKPNDLPPLSEDELADLPELPDGWRWVWLASISELGTGTTPSRAKPRFWEDGSVPWVTSAAVNDEYCDEPSELVTDAAIAETRLELYPSGTLLLALYGEGKTRGKVTELRFSATINQALAAIRFTGVASSCRSHVKRFLQRNYQQMRERSAGGVQPNLNLGLVSRFRIPVAPVEEQKQIIDEIESRLSVIDRLDESIDEAMAQAEALRQSILKKAFEGRLLSESELAAVRADPAYEPAEKLLERIRAEREQAEGAKPARGRGRKATQPTRQIKLPKGERYRQAAYAAYAVKRLSHLPTFGRVQQMKFLYLVPHLIHRESHIHAERKAAGPLDPAIHKVESLAQKNNWFTAQKSGKRVVYSPANRSTRPVPWRNATSAITRIK